MIKTDEERLSNARDGLILAFGMGEPDYRDRRPLMLAVRAAQALIYGDHQAARRTFLAAAKDLERPR